LKILIASSALYPENSPRAFRATELAVEFSRQGHEVTVITQDRGSEATNFCKSNSIKLKVIDRPLLKPIRIATSTFFNLFTRAVNRIMLLLFEYPEVELVYNYHKALKGEMGYDLLISVAVPYPVHWGVALAWNRKIAKCWVADCGDPYMGNESDSFKKLFYFRYVEKWMFRKPDYIAIPIESARHAYYSEFHAKIVVIPQGLNFARFKTNLAAYKPNKVPTFAYAGTFIQNKRDPRVLIEFLLELNRDYRFYIYSSTPGIIEPLAARSNGRIILLPPIPREKLITKLSSMDFLINIDNSTTTQAPSKLIDYFLTERPVVNISSGAVDKNVITKFMNGDYSDSFVFTGYEQYNIDEVSNRFLTLVSDHKVYV